MANRYWVGGTGDWDASDTTHWSATSGGSGGQSVPTSADSVILDASFGGGTITLTDQASVLSLNTNTFTGTLNTNGQSLTLAGSWENTGTSTRTMNLGSSLISLYQLDNTTTTGLTWNAGTSTIKLVPFAFNVYLRGGGLTYYNFWISRGSQTNTIAVSGSNTFNEFKDDGTGAHTITFVAGTTQAVSTFTVSGNPGALISLVSLSAGSAFTLSCSSGVISRDYLSIQDSTAIGGATWYAGANSTNVSGNTGWIFTAPPIPPSTMTNVSTMTNITSIKF